MNNTRKTTIVTVCFSLLFLGTSFYLWKKPQKKEDIEKIDLAPKKKMETEIVKEETVFIDIKGEVKNPGLYEMPSGQRVMDVIVAAGGLTEMADTSSINLSKKVEDQMVIVVPKEGAEESIQNDARIDQKDALLATNKKGGSSIISINQATKEELMQLNGIGSSKAQAILDYRQAHGGFKSKEELLEIKGIGESIFSKIKDHITL